MIMCHLCGQDFSYRQYYRHEQSGNCTSTRGQDEDSEEEVYDSPCQAVETGYNSVTDSEDENE